MEPRSGVRRLTSPETVRLSHAAALTLGVKRGRFYNDTKLGCINLLQRSELGCRANCAYCGQAYSIQDDPAGKSLIRVDWPERPTEEVVRRIDAAQQGRHPHVQRVCVGSLVGPKEALASIEITAKVTAGSNVKISCLLSPTSFSKEDFVALRDAGAENLTIAIDCVTPRLFEQLRGRTVRSPHRWERYLEGISEAVQVMGPGYNRVGVHVIIGLGETEQEACAFMARMYAMGVAVHLFAFYPEEGILLEDRPPVEVRHYRHIQLVRHLLDRGMVDASDLRFDEEGFIIDFGLPAPALDPIIDSGVPFMTTGCSGCNRPFSNETPSMAMHGQLRNYPWQPKGAELLQIQTQLQPIGGPASGDGA